MRDLRAGNWQLVEKSTVEKSKSQKRRRSYFLTFDCRLWTLCRSLESVAKPHFQPEHAVLVALAEKRHLVREVVQLAKVRAVCIHREHRARLKR